MKIYIHLIAFLIIFVGTAFSILQTDGISQDALKKGVEQAAQNLNTTSIKSTNTITSTTGGNSTSVINPLSGGNGKVLSSTTGSLTSSSSSISSSSTSRSSSSIGSIGSLSSSLTGNQSLTTGLLPSLAKESLNVLQTKLCTNDKCLTTITNTLKTVCENPKPYFCNGACISKDESCTISKPTNCTDVCEDGTCAPCKDYNGCPISSPILCLDGKCSVSISNCLMCDNGLPKCYDHSCQNPCPFLPSLFKPINIFTTYLETTQSSYISVTTSVSIDSQNSSLNKTNNTSSDSRESKTVWGIIIPPSTFQNNTEFYIGAVADSVVGRVKNGVLNNQLLLSSVVNITAVHQNQLVKKNFNSKVRLEFHILSSLSIDQSEMCLAYIDEDEMIWKCVDDKITISENRIIGFTDHFTSFAILTNYNTDSDSQSTFNVNKKQIIIGSVVGCFGLTLIIVATIIIYQKSKKHQGFKKWLFYNKVAKGSSSPKV
ncbi:hypothetical protein CYY_002604 [Polysphondylium violaceum]|uniref:Uncharacterized protein n=1 Tax=Polysphondylium violaceum TaxID=133409 RepID=A0A8J4PYJ5_9MYCE|nr:hypothetical protein CYY_002604 [Polysphondylium violaceum]